MNTALSDIRCSTGDHIIEIIPTLCVEDDHLLMHSIIRCLGCNWEDPCTAFHKNHVMRIKKIHFKLNNIKHMWVETCDCGISVHTMKIDIYVTVLPFFKKVSDFFKTNNIAEYGIQLIGNDGKVIH